MDELVFNDKEKEIIESILINSRESCDNYRLANKHIKKYTKMICKILEDDDQILYKFIQHNEPAVRSTGAYYLLPINKKIAEKTLKSLFKINEYSIGFDAKMIMREWKGKRLKHPRIIDGKVVYEFRYNKK
ncbi:MAG: hypothetical protein FWD28_01165 [Treponema sp.]|nr:hypothetical protein [Treponema sp.]